MRRSRVPRGVSKLRGALFLFCLTLGAAGPGSLISCSGPGTAGEGAGEIGPVVVSRAAGRGETDPLVASWWSSFFRQCQAAVKEKDTAHLESLLRSVEGKKGPAWAEESLARYGSVLRGMKLVAEGRIVARFALPHMDFRQGDIVYFGLRLENHLDGPVSLPAPGARGYLQARLRIVDYGVFGEEWVTKRPLNLPLDRPLSVAAGKVKFEGFQPFKATIPPGAVMRVVRFEGDLLLGSVLAAGEILPLKSIPAQPTQMRVFPKGYEPIAGKPLLTLKRALELGDRKHYPHLLIAAVFMPAAAREEARALLQAAARKDPDGGLGKAAAAALKLLESPTREMP